MKKINLLSIFLFLLTLCVVLLGAGCEKEEEIGVFSEKEFLKFSDFQLPLVCANGIPAGQRGVSCYAFAMHLK